MKNYFTKSKSGNISVMVILVLMACGLIGLLALSFVRQIANYNWTVLWYYKSYYISRAGLELSLAQVSDRWVGFQYRVQSGDNIVSQNFDCYPYCSLTTRILGQSSGLNKKFWLWETCNSGNFFVLGSGKSIVIPLFKDIYAFDNKSNVFGKTNYQSIFSNSNPQIIYKKMESSDLEESNFLSLWFFTDWFMPVSRKYSWSDIGFDLIQNFLSEDDFPTSIQNEMDSRKQKNSYLIISNPTIDNSYLTFCIWIQGWVWSSLNYSLATDTAYINSLWSFGNRSLWLEAKYAHDVISDFLVHGYIEF